MTDNKEMMENIRAELEKGSSSVDNLPWPNKEIYKFGFWAGVSIATSELVKEIKGNRAPEPEPEPEPQVKKGSLLGRFCFFGKKESE